jgi:hypothetical protein
MHGSGRSGHGSSVDEGRRRSFASIAPPPRVARVHRPDVRMSSGAAAILRKQRCGRTAAGAPRWHRTRLAASHAWQKGEELIRERLGMGGSAQGWRRAVLLFDPCSTGCPVRRMFLLPCLCNERAIQMFKNNVSSFHL